MRLAAGLLGSYSTPADPPSSRCKGKMRDGRERKKLGIGRKGKGKEGKGRERHEGVGRYGKREERSGRRRKGKEGSTWILVQGPRVTSYATASNLPIYQSY